MRVLSAFIRNDKGTLATAFALLSIPLSLSIALMIDYTSTLRGRDALRNTADTAALAGANAAGAILSRAMFNDDATRSAAATAADTAAKTVFASNGSMSGIPAPVPTVAMTAATSQITVTVDYSYASKSAFSHFFTSTGTQISGQATAIYSFPPYIDIHVLLDTSGSMGLGATRTSQIQMRNDPSLGCIFGCHVQNSSAYTVAKAKGYKMRIDVLRDSLTRMIDTAISQSAVQATPTVRIGLYNFSNEYSKIADASYELSTIKTKAQAITLSSSGGGTDFYNAMAKLNTDITRVGDGSGSSQPRVFVFIITDGVEDGAEAYKTGGGSWSWKWDPDNPMPKVADWGVRPVPKSYCQAFKSRGITVSALYTTYVTFDPAISDPWDTGRENNLNNNVIPNIPNALRDCSSGTGNFFQADKPEDIDNAIQLMFSNATAPLRLAR
jgi:hypothetical protein